MGLLDKLFGRDTPSQEIVGKVDKEGPRNPIDQLGVTGRSQRNAAYEDTAHIPRITDYVAEKLSQLLRYSTEMPVLRLTEDNSPRTDHRQQARRRVLRAGRHEGATQSRHRGTRCICWPS